MIDDCDMLGTRPPVLSIEIVLLASMLSNFGGIFGGKGIELVRASLLPIFLEGLRFLIDVVAGHGWVNRSSADHVPTRSKKSSRLATSPASAFASSVPRPLRIIANEISVQPVGSESELKDVTANLDDAIEKNYEAALIAWVNNTFGLKRRMAC